MRKRFWSIALLVPAIVLVAATCVGETRQRGPSGPWVGEVTNYGREPAPGAYVTADVFTADGTPLGPRYAYTCPATIPPGGHGTFELFVATRGDEKLPLRATFAPVALPGAWGGELWEGFTTRFVSTNPAKRVAMVEVRNDSGFTIDEMQVCGNIRTASGDLLEVGTARMFPTVLHPGQSQTTPVFFNTMPSGNIRFEFFAQGAGGCCSGALTFNPSDFQVTATRITSGPAGRMLVVAGEMANRSGQDLSRLRLEAYVEGAPETRVPADLGCGGIVGFGQSAAATFAIPIASGIGADDVDVAGVEAERATSGGEQLVAASDITIASLPDQPDGLGSIAVGATLTNPTTKWLDVHAACATIRDQRGAVIGVVALTATYPEGGAYLPLLAPGATIEISGASFVLGIPTVAEVQAYGAPRDFGPVP